MSVFAVLLLGAACLSVPAALTTYDAPSGAILNSDFSVEIREPEGEWVAIPSYTVWTLVTNDATTEASLAHFDCDGPVEVRVT